MSAEPKNLEDMTAEELDALDQMLGTLQDGLTRHADKAGEGLKDRRKSDLKTESDRALFIDAYGIDAYRKLPD